MKWFFFNLTSSGWKKKLIKMNLLNISFSFQNSIRRKFRLQKCNFSLSFLFFYLWIKNVANFMDVIYCANRTHKQRNKQWINRRRNKQAKRWNEKKRDSEEREIFSIKSNRYKSRLIIEKKSFFYVVSLLQGWPLQSKIKE